MEKSGQFYIKILKSTASVIVPVHTHVLEHRFTVNGEIYWEHV